MLPDYGSNMNNYYKSIQPATTSGITYTNVTGVLPLAPSLMDVRERSSSVFEWFKQNVCTSCLEYRSNIQYCTRRTRRPHVVNCAGIQPGVLHSSSKPLTYINVTHFIYLQLSKLSHAIKFAISFNVVCYGPISDLSMCLIRCVFRWHLGRWQTSFWHYWSVIIIDFGSNYFRVIREKSHFRSFEQFRSEYSANNSIRCPTRLSVESRRRRRWWR